MVNYLYEKSYIHDLVAEGDYEVYIEEIEKKTLPSGKEKLSVRYRIRADVEQEYKNRVLFEDIWAEKQNPEFFNRKRLNQLLGTQLIEDKTEFENIEAIIEFLKGAHLITHVSVVFDDFRKEDVNTISYYKSCKAIIATLTKVVGESTPAVSAVKVDLADDDLPF